RAGGQKALVAGQEARRPARAFASARAQRAAEEDGEKLAVVHRPCVPCEREYRSVQRKVPRRARYSDRGGDPGTATLGGSGVKSSPGLMKRSLSIRYCLS